MTDLTAWVRERLDNCQRIAVTKEGSDRDGWLEDAAYFAAILDALTPRADRDPDIITWGRKWLAEHPGWTEFEDPDDAGLDDGSLGYFCRHFIAAYDALALGVLHPSREVISDRDHLQTAWDALLREIETLQRATNYDPHPDDEINVSLTVAQAHALEEVAEAALSARVVSREDNLPERSGDLPGSTPGAGAKAPGGTGASAVRHGGSGPHPPLSTIAEAERALEHAKRNLEPFDGLLKAIQADGAISPRAPIATLAGIARSAAEEVASALTALREMTGAADPRNREEANGWRHDMENAPRDGTPVDLWKRAPDGKRGRRIADVKWDTHRSFNGGIGRVLQPDAWTYGHGGEVHLDGGVLTHWRLVPPPPSQESEG